MFTASNHMVKDPSISKGHVPLQYGWKYSTKDHTTPEQASLLFYNPHELLLSKHFSRWLFAVLFGVSSPEGSLGLNPQVSIDLG